MPRKIGTENWRKKRCQEYLNKKEYRYYIFCEGEKTEPNYFNGFKKLIEDNSIYRDMVLIQIESCRTDTIRVLEQAEKYVKENHITKGQIWCVYDKDDSSTKNFNEVVSRIESLNEGNPPTQYHAAWSNECIEFWFILHFNDYKSKTKRTAYINFLNDKYAQLGLGKYKKNANNTFNILIKYGNPKLAIRYAKRIISEHAGLPLAEIAPGTKVYELVEELAKYLPPDNPKVE